MSKLVTPLTATKINAAKPKDRLYKLSDGGGLALWIYPSGKKTWRFEYRRLDKKRDTITFGGYPEVSLLEARQLRDEKRQLTTKGVDPKLSDGKNAITLAVIFEQWYERWHPTVSTSYALQMHRSLEANILPKLGHVDVTQIKPKDVVNSLLPMEKRGSLVFLRRTKQALSMVFDFGIARGLCEFNPVSSISNKAFKAPEKKHYNALKPNQLGDLLGLIYNSKIEFVTKHCIMWQLLTLCRPSEATNATWVEIDLDNRLWVIPAERMKAGREHIVPISSLAFEIISEMKRFHINSEFAFLGRDLKTPINRETPRVALRRFRQKGIDTTFHGLRALARTYLEESGLWRTEAMESALAHIETNKILAAYNRADYLDEKREMLEWWGNEVKKFINF